MRLTRYTKAADFYQRAEPYLLEREAQHNLILGVCTVQMQHPETIREQPYFAVVQDDYHYIISAAMIIPPNDLVIAHTLDHQALRLIAEDVQKAGFTFHGVQSTRETSRAFADLWQSMTGDMGRVSMSMGVYELVAVTPVIGAPGQMRRAAEPDRELLNRWIMGFYEDAHLSGPPPDPGRMLNLYLPPGVEDVRGMYLWEVEGQPVSLAAYVGPTPNGIRINTVYTPPENRRRGYASALVAALSQYQLDIGRRFCFLFTDLSNPTSNKIYQDIGYRPVCEVDQIVFEQPDPQS